MIITLVALPIVGFIAILKGGYNINFTLSSLVGNLRGWPAIAGVIGGLSWGLGYFGQPHTIVRYMSIKDPEKIRISRNIAIVWSIPAFLGAFLIWVRYWALGGIIVFLCSLANVYLIMVWFITVPWWPWIIMGVGLFALIIGAIGGVLGISGK